MGWYWSVGASDAGEDWVLAEPFWVARVSRFGKAWIEVPVAIVAANPSLVAAADGRVGRSGRRESNSRPQLGNLPRAEFGGFWRTGADDSPSSDGLSGQLRTGANEGECAIDVPWREVEVRLPSAVAGALENAAAFFGISLEALVVQIVTQGRGGPAADKDSGREE